MSKSPPKRPVLPRRAPVSAKKRPVLPRQVPVSTKKRPVIRRPPSVYTPSPNPFTREKQKAIIAQKLKRYKLERQQKKNAEKRTEMDRQDLNRFITEQEEKREWDKPVLPPKSKPRTLSEWSSQTDMKQRSKKKTSKIDELLEDIERQRMSLENKPRTYKPSLSKWFTPRNFTSNKQYKRIMRNESRRQQNDKKTTANFKPQKRTLSIRSSPFKSQLIPFNKALQEIQQNKNYRKEVQQLRQSEIKQQKKEQKEKSAFNKTHRRIVRNESRRKRKENALKGVFSQWFRKIIS